MPLVWMVLLLALAFRFAEVRWCRHVMRRAVPAELGDVQSEISALKRTMRENNTIDGFVAFSKAQRQLAKKEKELEVLRALHSQREKEAQSSFAKRIPAFCKAAIFAISCQAFDGLTQPIASIPASMLAPYSWLLSGPAAPAGSITLVPWGCISYLLASRVMKEDPIK
eukprot:tig00021357_g20780.t1